MKLNTQEVMQQSVALTQECHDELQEAIMNYEAIVDHLERLWESKVSYKAERMCRIC